MPWTTREEEKLRDIIARHGAKRWNAIATMMNESGACDEPKTAKQCRRRYTGHLTNEIKEHEWTREEDDALLEAHERLGNKWTEIARIVGGRTDNGAKNRYKALVQKLGASKRRRRASGARATTTATKATKAEPADEIARAKAATGGKRKATQKAEAVASRGARGSKRKSTLGENAARSRGEERISPTLFMSSPTSSPGASERLTAWRPTLSINIPSRDVGRGGKSALQPSTSLKPAASLSGIFPAGYSVGKTLSLSCAELDLLKEVQEMISPRVMAANSPGGSNGSAFVRYADGASRDSEEKSTNGLKHVMSWLLSATPATTVREENMGDDRSAVPMSSRRSADNVSVSLAPNEDGSDALERGATLKHFLSLKTEGTTPRSASARPGSDPLARPVSIPSFTESELNLLLNALGGSTQASPRAGATASKVEVEPIRATRHRRTRA